MCLFLYLHVTAHMRFVAILSVGCVDVVAEPNCITLPIPVSPTPRPMVATTLPRLLQKRACRDAQTRILLSDVSILLVGRFLFGKRFY